MAFAEHVKLRQIIKRLSIIVKDWLVGWGISGCPGNKCVKFTNFLLHTRCEMLPVDWDISGCRGQVCDKFPNFFLHTEWSSRSDGSI